VLRFVAGSILAGLASATIATLAVAGQVAPGQFFASWLSTVVLGIVIVAPMAVETTRALFSKRAQGDLAASAKVALFVAVAVISGFTF
jgi:integral membrane sensor domain MASE1